jgi:hypothetical protein
MEYFHSTWSPYGFHMEYGGRVKYCIWRPHNNKGQLNMNGDAQDHDNYPNADDGNAPIADSKPPEERDCGRIG